MTRSAFGCLLLLLVEGCAGHVQQPLCPKHIETPFFPPIARAAHVTGKITLHVAIDADGNVKNVEATADNPVLQAHPLLQKYAVENMQHWTFAKPSSTPYTQTIVYDYEFDDSLPPEGGLSSLPEITRVNFDLPDRVEISTNLRIIDVSKSGRHD
jgi:Gram-negative bacterial TonB protein C-terminal